MILWTNTKSYNFITLKLHVQRTIPLAATQTPNKVLNILSDLSIWIDVYLHLMLE